MGGDVLSSHLHFFLFEGLVQIQSDGTIIPAQSHHFTVSPDKTTYTFSLGKTYWSDGSPVTAYDFARSWKSLLSPSFPSPHAHLFYPIKHAREAKIGSLPLDEVGIYTPDAQTLIIELLQPTPYFLELLSFCAFYPTPQESTVFLSNGPFTLDAWHPGEELILKKNPFYPASKQPKLETISLTLIESEATALQLYKKGELDLLGDPFSRLSPDLLIKIPPKEQLTIPVSATLLVTFNTQEFPFSCKKLRHAFHKAILRQEIVDNVMNQGDTVALGLLPPSMRQREIKPYYLDQDTEKAQQLLVEALQELHITRQDLEKRLCYLYPDTPMHKKIAQVLQQQWKQVLQLHIPIQSMDTASLLSALVTKSYCFAQTLCRAQYRDPTSLLERFTCKEAAKNYPSWEDPRFQELLRASYYLEGSDRTHQLEEAEKLLLQEAPISPLIHLSLPYAKKPYLHNIEYSPSGGIFFERLSIES